MHKSILTDGSAIEINIEIENFPIGIIEIEIELKFNNWNITTLIVCSMQCMSLDRYKITWVYVCLSEICIVHDSNCGFCPIFLEFGI